MKIYLASRFQDQAEMREWARKIDAAGLTVVSSWVLKDVDPNHDVRDTSDDGNRMAAVRDINDIEKADIVVAFSPPEHFKTGRGGRHAEYGYAIARGMRIVIVGQREHIFHWLRPCIAPSDLIDYLVSLSYTLK